MNQHIEIMENISFELMRTKDAIHNFVVLIENTNIMIHDAWDAL